MSSYIDPIDGSRYPFNEPRWSSDAGRPLWIEPGPGIGPDEIVDHERSLWRYAASLPVEFDEPVSLGEGCTPLRRHRHAGGTPYVKLEWFSPTGSFKDRGTSVMLSYLRARGVTAVIEDSSGNGGSSVAGYAAAGGMRATIFAPASTSSAKIAQVAAYGAEIRLVDGPRVASQQAAIAHADGGGGSYASHNWQAFFLQGTKTLAYEIWEDLGLRAPDNVIMPVGAGSSLLGCHLGFTELRNADQIERLPRLFAAQPLNCSPVDASFGAGAHGPVERTVRPTIAEGTAIAHPLRQTQILDALRRSNGATVAVSESEIVDALRGLCEAGLFVEPTSATAAAAYRRLRVDGRIDDSQTTVVILTGAGLKASATVRDLIRG